MPVRFTKSLLTLAIAALFPVAMLWGQAPKKEWKDNGAEYKFYDAAAKQTDNTKKLDALNAWKEKYPTSDYNMERLQLFLQTYNALNQADRVVETGSEILAADPKFLAAAYLMTAAGTRLPKPIPEQLAKVEKAAKSLTADLDSFKPAAMSDADWAKSKPDLLSLGYMTLGWLSMNRKEYPAAEKNFTECLKVNPNNGQVSYWLGTVIVSQRNPDTYPVGLFHIARAASYAGAGAMSDAGRKPAADYLTKAYTTFHGTADGLDELRKTAAAQAFPAEGFTLKSKAQLDIEKEEDFKKANPMLALWQTVKTELTGANGATYFESSMKGALLPGGAGGVTAFKGKLIAAKPPKNPKELVLAISDATTPEVTLVMEEPLVGSAPVGTDLQFEGVASGYTASPFMVTFDIEPGKLQGWPAPPPSPTKKGAKKAAPAAKKQ